MKIEKNVIRIDNLIVNASFLNNNKYNDQYYKNVEIFIGLLIVSGLLSVLFKKKVPLPVPVK